MSKEPTVGAVIGLRRGLSPLLAHRVEETMEGRRRTHGDERDAAHVVKLSELRLEHFHRAYQIEARHERLVLGGSGSVNHE